MINIPFIQYKRPHGIPYPVSIQVSTDIGRKALEIIERGYRFEIEVLTTGDVSMTIVSDEHEEGDLDGELCSNGPEVPAAVDRMINRFYAELIR